MTVTPVSFAANVGSARDSGGFYNATSVGAGAVPLSATVETDLNTTVSGDIDTLVADGASPTQAHVTTLEGHFDTLQTDWAAYKAATDAATTANVSVTFDKTAITSMNQLKSALNNIMLQIAGSGLLTP